jgi:hypothetical protein
VLSLPRQLLSLPRQVCSDGCAHLRYRLFFPNFSYCIIYLICQCVSLSVKTRHSA